MENGKCLVTITEIIAMSLTQGALGPYWHENTVSDIPKTEFSRYGRSKMPIGIKKCPLYGFVLVQVQVWYGNYIQADSKEQITKSPASEWE